MGRCSRRSFASVGEGYDKTTATSLATGRSYCKQSAYSPQLPIQTDLPDESAPTQSLSGDVLSPSQEPEREG